MPYYLRTATPADAAGVLAVYRPYVEQTAISFEVASPTVDEYAQRIAQKLAHTTFIVAVDEATDAIAGFAYNGSFRERPAYDWASEISIYLAPEHQGKGLGSVLLDALEELMRDADLGRLGTEDFPERALLFRRELEQGGRSFTDLEFWRTEAAFLNGVNYFSEAARRLRGPGLERNRARVAAEVRRLSESRGK